MRSSVAAISDAGGSIRVPATLFRVSQIEAARP
jgi:hypothetical protein